MNTIVPFEGPSHAKLYLVGEAPGSTEETEGRPFVGGSGRLLNRLLMESGISRGECRLGNVMRVRPKGNDFKHFYLDTAKKQPSQELLDGIRYLKEDIKATNPNLVVALGNEPMRALFGRSGVTNWRGSILWGKDVGCKVIPTFHPASLLRAWSNVPLVMFDFRRIREEMKSPDHAGIPYVFTIEPTFDQVIFHLSRIKREKPRVAFDVETNEDRHITAVGFAWSDLHSISIPLTNSAGAPFYTPEEEVEIWKRLKDVLEDPEIEKIAHNAQFDVIMFQLNPFHINVRGLVLDTMVGFHTLYPEIAASEKEGTTGTMKHKIGGGKKLGLLCSIYTRQPYYKFMIHQSGRDFWKYNCLDCLVTYQSGRKIEEEMRQFGVFDFYHHIPHAQLYPLMDVQTRGVLVDEEVREKAAEEYKRETEKLERLLNAAAGYEVNVNSPKQLKEFLFEDLGLPPTYKRGKTSITTDEDALKSLAKKYPSRVFDLILQIRRNRKIVGTYLEGNVGEDGRMRCSYIVGGTETGRLSSRGSVFGSGTNLQNFPHGTCRRMMVADVGMVMVAADLAQAEARVVAYEAEETRMIKVFESGGDIHQLTADGLPPDFVPQGNEFLEHPNPRRLFAKKHVHAFNYGESAFSFGHLADLDKKTAERIRNGYFDRFPAIRAWHLSIQSQLNRTRTVQTPLGRKRTFFGMWGDSLFKEAYAYIPQSTVGDITNLALIRLAGSNRCQILLTTHDEIIVQCKPSDVGVVVREMKEAFYVPISIKGREMVIPVEVKVGPNWEDLVEQVALENKAIVQLFTIKPKGV